MKRIALVVLLSVFCGFSLAWSAPLLLTRATSVRFPVEVNWDKQAVSHARTEILIVNLKSTDVSVSFAFYSHDGIKLACTVMPSPITVNGNSTYMIGPSGCFAIALGAALDFNGFAEISAPSKSVNIFWRIYGENDELIDHGKESP